MLRIMKTEDYDAVYALWKSIKGLPILCVDDTYEGIKRFLLRNPLTSVVNEVDGRINGSILCGHDGRRGFFYHVCVAEEARMQGVGKAMVEFCKEALRQEGITVITLFSYKHNKFGKPFWEKVGWKRRDDLNTYRFILNEENIVIPSATHAN